MMASWHRGNRGNRGVEMGITSASCHVVVLSGCCCAWSNRGWVGYHGDREYRTYREYRGCNTIFVNKVEDGTGCCSVYSVV